MKPKTVAERAAELGTDKWELVRALKALCRYKLKNGKAVRNQAGWGSYWYYPKKRLMTTDQAAAMLGVDPDDAEREIKMSYPIPWDQQMVLTGLIEFIKREGHWPAYRELRNKNGLPSPTTYQWFARRNSNGAASPRDVWERRVAADRRCNVEMALQLRNVLARKEALDRIGFDKIVKSGVAELIDEHPEFGELYALPGETPTERMVLVKVINSTPEPDGSFSNYFLRVSPEMSDVREAVKWTFNGREALGDLDYAPLIET